MHVQYDTITRQIVGYGVFTAPPTDPNLTIAEVPDTPDLSEPGKKTLNPDGTITVTPPAPDRAAHAALMEQKWQASQDKKLIAQAMKPGATITPAHFAALARQAGAV